MRRALRRILLAVGLSALVLVYRLGRNDDQTRARRPESA